VQVEKASSYLSSKHVTEEKKPSVGIFQMFIFLIRVFMSIPIVGPLFSFALILNTLCFIHLCLPNAAQELVVLGLEGGLYLLALLFSPLLYSASHIPQTEAFAMLWQSIRTHAGSLVMEATSSQATAVASSYLPTFTAFFASATSGGASAPPS